MSRSFVTTCGAALAVMLISGQSVFAQKLSKQQRDEVKSIVAETEKKLGEQIEASTNKLAALIKAQRSDPAPVQTQPEQVSSNATLQLLAASLVGSTPSPLVGGKVDVNKYLQDLVDDAKACEDRERFRSAFRSLVSDDDCTGCRRPCDYKDPVTGKIDVNKLLQCEIDHQLEIENRARFRKAFKQLLSGDDCCEEKKKEQACNPTSTHYSPVVFESPSWSYYRPICVD